MKRAAATTIIPEGPECLSAYSAISIAFETTRRVEVSDKVSSATMVDVPTRSTSAAVVKDYDAIAGNHPLDWPARFDVGRWTFLAAYRSGVRVGGAVLINDDRNVDLLEGQSDLALLWDLRVAPGARGTGVGSALLCVAKSWAWSRFCTAIKVETQDINVAACRLYARHGFRLRAVNPGAYPDLPDEIQLLWYGGLAGMAD
jgi:GNAT superfamily N-acetyltransferase